MEIPINNDHGKPNGSITNTFDSYLCVYDIVFQIYGEKVEKYQHPIILHQNNTAICCYILLLYEITKAFFSFNRLNSLNTEIPNKPKYAKCLSVNRRTQCKQTLNMKQ